MRRVHSSWFIVHGKKIVAVITMSLLCLIMPQLAQAATYYLDAVNGNDSYAGTSEQPWKTVAHALSSVTGGDMVIMATGFYGRIENQTAHGPDWFSSEVIFKAAPGAVPEVSGIQLICVWDKINGHLTFDGLKVVTNVSDGYDHKIQSKNLNYMKFKNMEVVGSGFPLAGATSYTAFYLLGENIEVSNCNIHGTTDQWLITGQLLTPGFGVGIECKDCKDTVIKDNSISQCYIGLRFTKFNNCKAQHNHIFNMACDGIVLADGSDLLITENIIHDLKIIKPTQVENPLETTWSEDGKTLTNNNARWNSDDSQVIANGMELVVISGTNVKLGDQDATIATVTDDTHLTLSKSLSNGGTPSNVNYYIRSFAHGDNIQANSATDMNGVWNVTISRNICYDNQGLGPGQLLFLDPRYSDTDIPMGRNWLIENNLFYDTYTSGDASGDYTSEYTANAAIRSISNVTVRYNTFHCRNQMRGDVGSVQVYGNIISYADWDEVSSVINEHHNIINRQIWNQNLTYAPTTTFLNGTWNNPEFFNMFKDYTAGDYAPASASALMAGKGDPASFPTTDILGFTRDAQPEAGCYEYTPYHIYYVDANNGDDANPGTSDQPWKTINRAIEGNSLTPNVKAGDTVYIRNGTYAAATFNYIPSPEPSSWADAITYKAAPGHHPKISSSTGAALTIKGLYKRYLDFNGIDMEVTGTGIDDVVYIQESGYIKIRNCSITGYWSPGIGGSPSDDADYLATTGLGIWSRGYTSTKNNDLQFDNLEITQVTRGIQTTEYFGTGFKVTNCKIHKVIASPINIGYNANPNHGEILVEGNEFYDEEAKFTGWDWAHGSIVGANSYMTIRNNIIHSCGASGGIMFYSNSPIIDNDGGYHDILIENNLIYDNINSQILKFYHIGDGSFIIRNNTIIGSQDGSTHNIYDYYGGGTVIIMGMEPNTTGAGFRFDNNILVGAFYIPVGFTGFHAEGNIMYAVNDYEPTPYTWSSTNTISRYSGQYYPHTIDAKFITNFFANVDSQTYFRRGTDTVRYTDGGPHREDYSTNFILNSFSPAINFGVVTQQTSTDILGNARDANHHSAGCYEYVPARGTVLYGDVSGEGEVTAYDAALTVQAAVGLITLTVDQAKAADVSGEGEVSAYDAALIAQRAVGLIEKFPVEN